MIFALAASTASCSGRSPRHDHRAGRRRLPVHRGDDGNLVRPTAAWLGPRKWRLLHLIGGWYIWISFAVAVGKRVPLDTFYWPMAVLVLAIAVMRLIAMFRRGRRRTTPGASVPA